MYLEVFRGLRIKFLGLKTPPQVTAKGGYARLSRSHSCVFYLKMTVGSKRSGPDVVQAPSNMHAHVHAPRSP